MTSKIKDLTIWITGASSGLGAAMAIECARQGATVVLSGRNEDKLMAVKKRCKHSGKHLVVAFDVTDAPATEQAYAHVVSQVKQIDWLINNAGVSQRALIMDTAEAVDRQLMEINYFAPTRLTRLVLPQMLAQGGGKIIMVSSVAGLLGSQYRGAYGAAKAAIHMWANSLRAELSQDNISVATVFPGFIQTQVSVNALTGDGSKQGTMDSATDKGMTATVFAKRTLRALSKGDEYIVVGGQKERLATLINRVSPTKLYQLIRQSQVK